MLANRATNQGTGMTRRTFLKGAGGSVVLVIAASSAGGLLAACATSATKDFSVTSSTDFNHGHKITVLGADVDKAPAEKTYTSDGATHQHAVVLKKADFQAIKRGREITITSTSTGSTPHTHTFIIKKPA